MIFLRHIVCIYNFEIIQDKVLLTNSKQTNCTYFKKVPKIGHQLLLSQMSHYK